MSMLARPGDPHLCSGAFKAEARVSSRSAWLTPHHPVSEEQNTTK